MAKRGKESGGVKKRASRAAAPATGQPGDGRRRVRYAVVGMGHIAQVAVLPAFAHARENSELVALFSDDGEKLRKLGRRYELEHLFGYDEFEEGLRAAAVDAVYIALPNHLHREYTERAANAGVHVLCEKPMAVTEEDCESMIDACDRNGVKLMIAYRLHFEEANLRAVEVVQSGRIGEPRIFNSVFTMDLKEGDIRLNPRDAGGGTLYDIGIYCINAARYLFEDEPVEVMALTARKDDPRFAAPGVDEMTGAVLRFPGERLATFVTSFGAADVSRIQVVGTRGSLVLDPAYEYAGELTHEITIDERTRERRFPRRDQFAPELVYFSECIETGEDPEPSGKEGLGDIRIIRALYASADSGGPVALGPFDKDERPTLDQEIRKPAVSKPRLVKTEAPHD
ncbi:MAG TPA: Gfo/Idh/MocA family oxidoreductase [Gemmatimonadales bacterium]|nr:Gfo/Idh/MocA family oxidoreductase [Gemmatimonadales bacterium]